MIVAIHCGFSEIKNPDDIMLTVVWVGIPLLEMHGILISSCLLSLKTHQ